MIDRKWDDRRRPLRVIASLIAHDFRVLSRHGLVAAYTVVVAAYIGIIALLPRQLSVIVAPFFVYSDPSMVGLLFTGVIVLLEDQWGIPGQFRVSGVRAYNRYTAWTIVFVVAGIVAAEVIAVGYYLSFSREFPVLWMQLAGAITTVSIPGTLIGIVIANRATSPNHFFLLLIAPLTAIAVPFLSVIPALSSPLWYVVPGWGPFRLTVSAVAGSTGSVAPSTYQPLTAALRLIAWTNAIGWLIVTTVLSARRLR